MAKSKATLEKELRDAILELLIDKLGEYYETDIMPVSASELTIPLLDSEGNEKFALIKVSIPRGTRNGEGGYIPYDGYEAYNDYVADQEAKAEEKALKKAARTLKQKEEEGE